MVVLVGAATNIMGKPAQICIDDQLMEMSCSTVKTQLAVASRPSTSLLKNNTATAAATAASSQQDAKDQLPPIPKVYIPKSLVRPQSDYPLPQHKRKMVDGIMQRLSIGPEQPFRDAERNPDYASKVFRKRANSSGQGYELGPKIQVIDNRRCIPGALPTPIVHGSSSSSVFKSDACDTALRKYSAPSSLASSEVKSEPSSPCSSTTSSSGRSLFQQHQPRPLVKTPPLDDFFRKPRTVAEKRIFLLQSPVEYKVMDFENTVYHLIKKLDRFGGDMTFRTQVELLMYGSVPTNRSIWKAVLWLNSQCDQYHPWHIIIDGARVRLLGATGSFELGEQEKRHRSIVSLTAGRQYKPANKLSCCGVNGAKRLANEDEVVDQFRNLGGPVVVDPSHACPKTLLEKRTATMANLKPGPLSVKVRRLDKSRADSELGPLEIYELPLQTFTATPQVNNPLPRRITSYLKLAAPDTNMTKDWLKYSLSVLQTPTTPATAPTDESKTARSFHFAVPYKNDQRKILVRRKMLDRGRRKGDLRNEDYERQMLYQMKFARVAAASEQVEEADKELVGEVEGILMEIIDSVAMSFSEDSFIRNDPDLTYQLEAPVKPLPKNAKESKAVDTTTNHGVSSRSRTTLKTELRRLNVTIIDTAKMRQQGDCTKDECLQGCVCESISRLGGLINHCTQPECIFGCSCSAAQLENDEQEQLRRIRDEKNRCLARAEKEFKSTIVLTNSNTILMSNSDDRKRNRTKPKRYFDYCSKILDSDEDDEEEQVVEGKDGERVFGKDNRRQDKRPRWHEALEPMRHCAVALPYIAQLDVLEPWCMVHELYRCFCGNQRLEGRPFKMQPSADGTIRANVKDSLMLNSRRRHLPVVKDELQQTLEPIPTGNDLDGCSRCRPTDFNEQFHTNRSRAPVINTKVRLAMKKAKQVRLDHLILKCLSCIEPPNVPRRRSMAMAAATTVEAPPNQQPQQTEEKRLRNKNQFMQHAQNELGLKITAVCSLDANAGGEAHMADLVGAAAASSTETAPPPPGKMLTDLLPDAIKIRARRTDTECYDSRMSEIKRRLLGKLNNILESCSETLLDPPYSRKVNFVRYHNFKALLERLSMFEVWADETGEAESVVLARDRESAEDNFPDHILVDVQDSSRKFYISKFVADESSKMQSNNIYIVLEGSGKNFWYVRGCQYIKDVQQKLRIQPEHTQRLRMYADRNLVNVSNLDVYQMESSGSEKLNVKLPVMPGTRYLMIDIHNDFSDIGHPRWKGLLSWKHMKQALDLAKLENKTIQVIRGPSNLRPNIYATPGSEQLRMFAGPFERHEPCNITLYQRVDSSLYLREEYESMLGIHREKQTTGFWLTNDQLHVESREMSPDTPATATVLPEVEIVKATVKTERGASLPDPVVYISTTRSDASGGQKTLLKPFVEEAQVKGPPSTSPSSQSVNTIKDLLANPAVSTFRLGNTIVRRGSFVSDSSSIPCQAPEKSAATTEVSDDDDDDVVLVEDAESDRIIDLDEWERVQKELDDEESSLPAENEQKVVVPVDEQKEALPEDEQREVAPVDQADSSRVQFDESIPFSGYYRSNIPNMGNIPAKILNGIVTMSLPIRKMPHKIAVECINRYMWKYLQNCVSGWFPKDLKVTWEFVNTYFPPEESLMKLEPSKHRNTCILTQYGVIDVLQDEKTEEDIPDPAVYLKYLASRLCVLVFKKLDLYTAEEIIAETLRVIKHERYQILKHNREITMLRMKREQLGKRLSEIRSSKEPIAGPSWAV